MLDTPRTFLRTEPVRLRNALVSLDHVLAATSDESLACRIDQQADFLITELEASIDRIRRAQTAVEASRAMSRGQADVNDFINELARIAA